MVKYKSIISDLLKNGKTDLPRWDKEEFITVCMYDYNVCRATAEKVYKGYHDAIRHL